VATRNTILKHVGPLCDPCDTNILLSLLLQAHEEASTQSTNFEYAFFVSIRW
jgi:hypothetical protein